MKAYKTKERKTMLSLRNQNLGKINKKWITLT
jgi:hypothetical protein